MDNHWVWPSGFEIHTGINFTRENVLSDFSITGVTVPIGDYEHSEFQFVLQTNPNKGINFYNRSFIGGYYGGRRIQLGNRINLRVGDKFNTYMGINYNYLSLENGEVNAFISSTRLSYSFTPQVFLQSLVQYNNVTNITSVNARFGWLKTAKQGCL